MHQKEGNKKWRKEEKTGKKGGIVSEGEGMGFGT